MDQFLEKLPLWFPENPQVPLGIKLAYTLFVAILTPVYWKKWGPANFLWFSDIALFGMLVAVWLESSLITSMMALAVLIPESGWNAEYFGRLLTGKKFLGLTDYMFDSSRSIFLRALSLFHVVLPVLIVWMLARLGFQEKALYYQIGLGWLVLLITYSVTDPAENINWVFSPGSKPQTRIKPFHYLLLVMVGFPLLFYLPAYFLLRLIFT